jgi:hypothetical protein
VNEDTTPRLVAGASGVGTKLPTASTTITASDGRGRGRSLFACSLGYDGNRLPLLNGANWALGERDGESTSGKDTARSPDSDLGGYLIGRTAKQLDRLCRRGGLRPAVQQSAHGPRLQIGVARRI